MYRLWDNWSAAVPQSAVSVLIQQTGSLHQHELVQCEQL